MATTSPTRIDDDLFASAKAVGEVMSRSASQQVSHWARTTACSSAVRRS